ncbi:hypothetical protein J421_1379 [Gemmatirosa kalamazoonensis]|uniref:Lipoprotein n=1 Tax=Gemmatirosa kalamazoonensis TaxID=861299 RepID=W0RDN5_9BACT|nr:hypothetical protein [Gemmatirosa kalamazoonensis]AHG88916.1 hypothetical protein J421_1379 [Gemmatirosa kalamazoonensis]
MRPPRIHDGLARAVALLLVSACASTTLRAQQPDSAQRGPIAHPTGALVAGDSSAAVVSQEAFRLNAGCQLSRAAVLGIGGYMGYVMGDLAALSMTPGHLPSRDTFLGVGVVGAVVGVVSYADVPLAHRLPFCPRAMRTVSGRSSLGAVSCRAARVVNGMLGFSSGSLVAFLVNLPGELGDGLHGDTRAHHKARAMASVTLPVAGAVAGVLMAGEQPVCRARRAAR